MKRYIDKRFAKKIEETEYGRGKRFSNKPKYNRHKNTTLAYATPSHINSYNVDDNVIDKAEEYITTTTVRDDNTGQSEKCEPRKLGKKSTLAYAAPLFPGNNNNNSVQQQQGKSSKKGETSIITMQDDIEEYHHRPGAFAVKPGGNIIPAANQQIPPSSGTTANISSKIPNKQQEEEEIELNIANATLVEDNFDTRIHKMMQNPVLAEIVQNDNEQKSKITNISKKGQRKKIAVGLSLLLFLIIIAIVLSIHLTNQSSSKGDDNNNTEMTITDSPITLDILSAASSPSFEVITLYLKLGKDSNDIGFKISCGMFRDDVIQARSAGTFVRKPGAPATEFNQVPANKECTVEVSNTAGTGLQPNGLLRIHRGKTISTAKDTILLELPGNFTDKISGTFIAELLDSQVPSIAPTVYPSIIPTISLSDIPSTTNLPSISMVPTMGPTSYPPTQQPPTGNGLGFNEGGVPSFGSIIGRPTTPLSPTPITSLVPSSSPTFSLYSIVVDIGLDFFPLETGWSLTCSNGTILKELFMPGSYLDSKEEILISYDDVEYNTECLFVIFDTAGDGICCSNGSGYYKITVRGDTTTTLFEFENNGEFGAESQTEFQIF